MKEEPLDADKEGEKENNPFMVNSSDMDPDPFGHPDPGSKKIS